MQRLREPGRDEREDGGLPHGDIVEAVPDASAARRARYSNGSAISDGGEQDVAVAMSVAAI